MQDFHNMHLLMFYAHLLHILEWFRFIKLPFLDHFPKKVLPHDSDVLCTHPMFGPESGRDGWKDLSFMYDKVRITNEAICSSFLQIFATEVEQILLY